MMEFLWPFAFLLLPLPLLVRFLAKPAPTGSGGALRVPFYRALVGGTAPGGNPSMRRGWWKLLLMSLAWGFLVTALARPVYVGDAVPLPVEGRDLMMAIDLSGSMAQEDFTQNGRPTTRLAVVKTAAEDFIRRREGDKVGMILFSDRAYLQAPLTFDRKVVAGFLQEAQVGLTGRQTAIGDAIAVAVKRLKDRPAENRVLILLTDGASNAGVMEPLKAAELAKDYGIRIYTIGVGAGAQRVQTAFGTQIVDPSRDLDEATLTKIAEMTGGRYFRAQNVGGLAQIYRELDRLEPVSGDARTVRPSVALYYIPLGVSLALVFVLGGLMAAGAAPAARKNSRLQEA